jgi:hypothetical protein
MLLPDYSNPKVRERQLTAHYWNDPLSSNILVNYLLMVKLLSLVSV